MENNEFLLTNIVAMDWTHRIALFHRISHAMENLQHRILDFSKYCLLHCHIKKERAREREELKMWFDHHRTDPALVACKKSIALQHMEQTSVKSTPGISVLFTAGLL